MHRIGEEGQQLSAWLVIGAWLLAGASLLAFLGAAPCNRSQEARVLVTAREMAQKGDIRWVLPACNGVLRLQKPPMAYWGAAVAFLASGEVSEFTGRLPSVLWAWLLLGVVYWAGARWFSRPVGLAAAGMLLTSYLFYRHGRLAETDACVSFAVTAAIVAFWRGLATGEDRESRWRAAAWCAAGGVATGMALLAKQGPGFYPLLFALAYGIAQRNWRGLRLVAWAGVIPTVLVGAPWYIYVVAAGYGGVLGDEAVVVAGGKDHGASVLMLLPQILMALAPWCGLLPAGMIMAWLDRRRPTAQAMLCWAGVTLLPLVLIRNKQIHYLMPAMPALMLLSAWALEQTAQGVAQRYLGTYVRLAFRALMAGAIIAGVTLVGWAGAMALGFAEPMRPQFALTAVVLGVLVLAVGFALAVPMKPGLSVPAALRAMVVMAAVFAWLFGVVVVQLEPADVHAAAQSLREVAGERRLVFYGEPSLSLVFQLGQTIPSVGRKSPLPTPVEDAIVVESEPGDPPATLPQPWYLAWRGGREDITISCGLRRRWT